MLTYITFSFIKCIVNICLVSKEINSVVSNFYAWYYLIISQVKHQSSEHMRTYLTKKPHFFYHTPHFTGSLHI